MIPSISHASTTHMAMNKTPTLKEFLQAKVSDRECQGPAQLAGLLALLLTYDHDGVNVQMNQ